MPSPRLAARAVIVRDGRLLVVNAYPEGHGDLWCAPGGGVRRGQSLPDTLQRELHEECGLHISVGAPCLVNEFHDPESGFHQVDVYFHAQVTGGALDAAWRDPAGVVTARRLVTAAELGTLRYKPDSLSALAFGPRAVARYDPIELILR